jgi:drug/metabolite transporter (DMT)-like permease
MAIFNYLTGLMKPFEPTPLNHRAILSLTPGAKYILVATFFFALMFAGVKMLLRIPSHEIVFFRAIVTLVVGYIMIVRAGLNPWGNNKKYLILRGLAGTGALICFFYTLQKMPLASAVTIHHLSPIFTVLISGFILRENARPMQWIFLVLAFGGVVMVKGFDPRITITGLMVGICAAFFSALAYNFVRKLKDYDHPLVVVFYFPLVTVPLVGIYSLTNWIWPDWSELVILLAVGLLTTVAQIYLTKAYQADRASNISIFNYLGIVYALIIGFVFFAETLPPMALVGIGVIIAGVVLSNHFRAGPEKDD